MTLQIPFLLFASRLTPVQIPFPLPDLSGSRINRKLLSGSARSTLGARMLDKLIDWLSLFRLLVQILGVKQQQRNNWSHF